jgi:hypothetical protein
VTARALTIACAALALAAPVAVADSFDDVFHDYQADGHIDPCKHTTAQLQRARDDVPPDIEQYAPDFPDALDRAIEARARGKCAARSKPATAPAPTATTGVPAPPTATTTGPTGPTGPTTPAATPAPAEPPAPSASPQAAPSDQAIARAAAHDEGDSDVPAPLLALAVLAGLLLVAGVGYGLTRWLAWEPGWALRARHATGEAAWRISATWAEFSDWLRFGR